MMLTLNVVMLKMIEKCRKFSELIIMCKLNLICSIIILN